MSEPTTRKMQYPKSCRMLQVRDCTVAICNKNNPGSVLMSTFLFWYEYPHTGDIYDEKAQTFTICRTQADIERQACNQIDVKTIHDTAVPMLQLLGYLTVKEKMNGNIYTLHMDRINAAYAVCRDPEALKAFLKSSLQLESALIIIPDDQLEPTLINKRALYLQLERVLNATRADSNCKRGRKPKPQAPSDGKFPNTENNRDSLENNTKREESSDVSPTSPQPDASLTLSSNSHDVFSSAGSLPPAQGGATIPPASVMGVPLSSSPGGDTQPSSGNAMDIPFVDTTIPIVTQMGTTPTNVNSQGYMNEPNHVGNAQGDSVPSGALSTTMQQSVMSNNTAEVSGITQEVTQPSLIDAPLVEPDMSGPWTAEKCVQYAEFHNDKRYPDKQRKVQIEAARALYRDDKSLTLAQFKQAYDERDDDWWRSTQVMLHVSHMRSKERSSGMVRLYAMLDRIEAREKKKIIPIRPKVDRSPEAVQRAKTNNQKTLEKVQRLLAEKREREEKNNAIAK